MAEVIEKQAKVEASLDETGKRLQELEQRVERLEARVESFIEDLRSEF